MNTVLVTLEDLGDGFVFMSPDYQVEELRNHAFRDGVPSTHAEVHPFVFVLVDDENVEPVVFVLQRSLEFYLLVFECHVKSLIFHVADAEQCDLRQPFSEQNRLYSYFFYISNLSEIIDVVILTHKVYVAEVFEAARVVMVPVDHEDRHRYRQILIHIVSVRVLIRLKLDVLLAKDSLVEHLLAFIEGLTARLMFVEQITSHQYEV